MKAPRFDPDTVLALLRRHYGLAGELTTLVSERDQNLRLDATDGERYVVKIANRAEDRLDAELQAAALDHLAGKDLDLRVPAVLRLREGVMLADLEGHVVRVATWVPGDVLERGAITPSVAASLGQALAALGTSLQDFDHRGKRRALTWNMEQALELRSRSSSIPRDELRAEVDAVFGEFELRALPQFCQLRRQVIHNDVNPENVLVDASGSSISGIIDFGDLVDAPLIVDVAVAGSYLRDHDDPMSLIGPFMRAYQCITPLMEEELVLLHLLLRVRLATTITMFHWRSAEFGDDDAYRQKTAHTETEAERFLSLLQATGEARFTEQLLS